MATPEPLLRRAEPLLFIAAAAFSLYFHGTLPSRLVDESDGRAAAEHVRAHARPGDVVLLYPWWTERARQWFSEDVPVVGHLHSDSEPLEDAPRVWLLAQPRLPRSDLPRFLTEHFAARTPIEPTRTFGNLALSLWRNGQHQPRLFSAAEQLDQATVQVRRSNGQIVPCPFDGMHRCPGGFANRVATEWHEVNQIPRRCIYVRVPEDGATVEIAFPKLPSGALLSLEGGVIWEYAARKGPSISSAVVSASAGGEGMASFTAQAGVEQRYTVQRSLVGVETERPWVLSVFAERAHDRQLCVDLLVRAPSPAEAP